jgi:hypothetical protein
MNTIRRAVTFSACSGLGVAGRVDGLVDGSGAAVTVERAASNPMRRAAAATRQVGL